MLLDVILEEILRCRKSQVGAEWRQSLLSFAVSESHPLMFVIRPTSALDLQRLPKYISECPWTFERSSKVMRRRYLEGPEIRRDDEGRHCNSVLAASNSFSFLYFLPWYTAYLKEPWGALKFENLYVTSSVKPCPQMCLPQSDTDYSDEIVSQTMFL